MTNIIAVSEIELHYKLPKHSLRLPQITKPHEAYYLLHVI